MAAMMATHPPVGYADIERWPEDGRRYELYDGEVSVIPSPLPVHQIVLGRLHVALQVYADVHGGLVLAAPRDIVLTEFDVVQPDVMFFTAARRYVARLRSDTAAPDLVVEILSAGTAGNDRGRKMQLFARHGVREYWLVDPDVSTIEVYDLLGGRYILASAAAGREDVRSTLLPELTLTPETIFPVVDRERPAR
jgi:Uma2 family endonuclease